VFKDRNKEPAFCWNVLAQRDLDNVSSIRGVSWSESLRLARRAELHGGIEREPTTATRDQLAKSKTWPGGWGRGGRGGARAPWRAWAMSSAVSLLPHPRAASSTRSCRDPEARSAHSRSA